MDFPEQNAGCRTASSSRAGSFGSFDMRDYLEPRRLAIIMWDEAPLLRHVPGGSFEDYDRVLDEVLERGYNCLRLDPIIQHIDLDHPERVLDWPDPKMPHLPWFSNAATNGPAGEWLIELMEKIAERGLYYTLSSWWRQDRGPENLWPWPADHREGAERWAAFLSQWESRFGFDRLVYVDISNEVPFFFPKYVARMKEITGEDWQSYGAAFPPAVAQFLADDLNGAMHLLQREFPALRFTASIHGDERWLDLPMNFDCLDVHFYASADMRWRSRSRFTDHMPKFFKETDFHREFSDACEAARVAMAPMARARQRGKLRAFAAWSEQLGMPLTTSESWASWFYVDSPNLSWRWLNEWAEWSVEDAIEFRMWGWTPHNYLYPHMNNWKDVNWHRRLTSRFLRS